MPAKNTKSKYHGRYRFISLQLWKKYKKTTGSDISYKEFRLIILSSMKEVANWVLKEPIGYRFPYRLGSIAVNRFRTYGDFKTYLNTKDKNGKPIRNFNLHTGGDCFRIQLFHNTRSNKERASYWFFTADRTFKRTLAKVLKSGDGPLYNAYTQDHFILKKQHNASLRLRSR